jgi:hypothetical protein
MRLSRTGWNNVIIFSVMAMILLINLTSKQLFQTQPSNNDLTEQAILGDDPVILTLGINNQLLIERIGRTWRAIPAKISGQALDQMMQSWQQTTAVVQTAPTQVDQQAGIIVTVELAGQQQAQVLSLYPVQHALFIYHHGQQQWFSLPLPIYRQLVPINLVGE